VLKGDRAVQYEKIMTVLDICSRAGVKSIGLASQHIAGS
jgi:biopolymer transport protein ExbD